jgi:hypothetical protein
VSIERRDGYLLWIGGPVPPGSEGITVGSVVCVRERAAGRPRLLRHEVVHVVQWADFGVVGFLKRYLGAYLRGRVHGYSHKGAYRRIPFEVEAEWVARRVEVSSD